VVAVTFAEATATHKDGEVPMNPCTSNMSVWFTGVPGFDQLFKKLCIDGDLHVPFGTMYWAAGSGVPAGMSMDFGPFGDRTTQATYEKINTNFLQKMTDTAVIPHTVGMSFADQASPVGAAANRTLATAAFVGVEVGNLQNYFDITRYAGEEAPTGASGFPTKTPQGGWGLPLCFQTINQGAPCPSGGQDCYLPVNCLNKNMLASENMAMRLSSQGVVARTRRAEFGPITHFYPMSCKDARDRGGHMTDGEYLLDLEVDGVTISAEDFDMNDDLKMLHPSGPTHWGVGRYKNKNYVTMATKMRTTVKVYCYKMKTEALAYLDVEESKNYGSWSSGSTVYTTFFSKLRFDEATQLIYTADCESFSNLNLQF